MVRLCPKTPLLWSTLTNKDSYWTPSRCAKILIVVSVTGLPANLYIYKTETGWRWRSTEWPCAVTLQRDSAPAPPVNTTTSRLRCHQHPSWPLWPPTCSSHNDKHRTVYLCHVYIELFIIIIILLYNGHVMTKNVCVKISFLIE